MSRRTRPALHGPPFPVAKLLIIPSLRMFLYTNDAKAYNVNRGEIKLAAGDAALNTNL